MDIEKEFQKLGGTFLTPSAQIGSSLSKVKAFIFDWDGVFNDGRKSDDSGSNFSEIDSMGLNIMRFDYWLRQKSLPYVYIITGMNNKSAAWFAKREHLDGVYMNFKNKREALQDICRNNKITPAETAFIFDDILDLELAQICGLSFMVGRKSNPLMLEFVKSKKICNYISAHSGQDHGVREICELIIGLSGDFNLSLELRNKFTGEYEEYFSKRNSVETIVKS
jgi:3-deoxy-D-manno-octulosonate 8-phosphate phosphatase (KDO 8-P phosphatase)